MLKYRNLIELFEDIKQCDKGIYFIEDINKEVFIKYEELYTKSLKILGFLQGKGVKPGDEIIFQIQDNQSFICVFWACILGGIIPVPIPLGNNEEHKLKIVRIWNNLNKPYLITESKLDSYLSEQESIKEHSFLIEEAIDSHSLGKIYTPNSDDIAFIQFSSGSTSDPKGVILTHENLLVNINAMLNAVKILPDDATLSWMPLTHDLGLVGFHISSLAGGINQYIMPTSLFIRHPILWIEKSNEYKISVLASPNFGYKHFLSSFKPELASNWDLSHIRLILNGAEPISSELCNLFIAKMSAYNLRSNVILPVYGLAEASLAVSIPPVGEEFVTLSIKRESVSLGQKAILDSSSSESVKFVDLGFPVQDCFVRICDEDNLIVEENTVGTIQITGKNVTRGYYNNPQATANAFTQDGWLDTGDIGFMRNGRLIVIGRKKDIIFINGQNYYPYDIEKTAEGLGIIESGKVAACSVQDEVSKTEEICIFVLFGGMLEDFVPIAIALKTNINKLMGLDIKYIIPVENLPLTASGKVQRYKLAENFKNGMYADVVNRINCFTAEKAQAKNIVLPESEIEKKIVELWEDVLGIENIGVTDNFFELGGNSLKVSNLLSRIEEQFNIKIPITTAFEILTVRKLSEFIEDAKKKEYSIIPHIEKREYYPVSSAQKRLVILNQIDSDITYNISSAMQIEGILDTERFINAFKLLVDRHESLRTSFEIIDGEPVQKISEKLEFNMDITLCKDEDVPELIKNFIRPFDLRIAPLIRAKLLKINNRKHILLCDMHHIISDGISCSILFNELIKSYQGASLNELKVQYKDYAVWQDEMLKTEYTSKEKKFWINQFSDEIPILNFPCDYQRPAVQSFEGSRVCFEINGGLLERLERLSIKTGTTLFMVFLAAYNILLHKYTGQEDIVVGTPVSGRTRSELNNVIGMFVNTLALRNYPKSNIKFSSFLQDVKNRFLMALENQDYQFEMLVDALKIKRNIDRNPLFDTMFVFQNMDWAEETSSDIVFSKFDFESGISKFDFTLYSVPKQDSIYFELEYATKLFKKSTIERFVEHYQILLDIISQNTEILISDIDILSKLEKNLLLLKFNQTQQEYPKNKTICDLFEEQVKKSYDCIAVEAGNQKLTYDELDIKSNSLAHKLREHGVTSDTIVGLLIERSIEFVVGIMAILKAGGAYLPIDPEYPETRIKYILEDAGAKILLTTDSIEERIEFDGTVINLRDSNTYSGNSQKIENINNPNDLAYVIYTSGSTGKPKGVMIPHKALNNYLHCIYKWYDEEIDKRDKCFSLANISFDANVVEIFMPLLFGATLVLNDQPILMDLEHLADTLADKEVTFAFIPPTILQDLCRLLKARNSKLNKILTGLENIKDYVLEEFFELNKDMKVLVGYGPTEATICASFYRYKSGKTVGKTVPIGKPLANTQIYLTDSNFKLVPLGVAGELCIAGEGLSRGYLNNPALTSEKFVDNPFSFGEKMYKTGDLAKWNSDGELEFLGRSDFQVKIRGYRVELGEIESKLLKHESVKEAVVLDRTDSNGNKYLCAYLVQDRDISASDFREFLSKDLPDYMIPSYYVRIQNIPLTSNGKIDRRALPEPTLSLETKYAPPRNDIEKELVEVWQEVLGIESVGIYDNFFELGGSSLKAIQVSGKLKSFGLNMMNILRNPTIAELSKYAVPFGGQGVELPEQMKKNIELDYYFDTQGNRDPLTENMDCANVMLYFILKKQLGNKGNYSEYFAQGFDMNITENQYGGIYDINFSTYHLWKDAFEIKNYKEKGTEAMSQIEQLLDKGEQLIVDIYCLRNPAFREFVSYNAPEIKERRGHLFMLVARDSDNLYSVEMPEMINPDRYIPYIENKSVGLIPKKDILPAFEFDVFYSTVTVNKQKLQGESKLRELVDLIIKNYKRSVTNENGLTTYYGEAALDKLIEISCKEFQRLDDKNNMQNRILQEILDWKLITLAHRRRLFKITLENYSGECNNDIKWMVIKLLEESAQRWRDICHTLTKKYNLTSVIDKEAGRCFTEIKELEKELMYLLERLWS
ncbi:amino acid adenylation domain-containing protein [Ruminiclostridium herbifermentans]|uniref:Amino acid adenylation domain-containing protein n=1 Tax=Ruminiclostridium herbifermentans TaxID=2488810 RepID=A0A4U7JK27_9FIRM|nr:non-ribosomal peptide synthetase [Ruminiclostridium herbifermentans]QNU68230.1 amino acid adenylation domain-containing protein [Ruminiclostridium herbifermentans]